MRLFSWAALHPPGIEASEIMLLRRYWQERPILHILSDRWEPGPPTRQAWFYTPLRRFVYEKVDLCRNPLSEHMVCSRGSKAAAPSQLPQWKDRLQLSGRHLGRKRGRQQRAAHYG